VPIDTKILTRSCATDRFKSDVIDFASRADVPSITLVRAVPRVKVVRLITQLLHAHPEWVVDRVQVDARSGCSDFVGTAVVAATAHPHFSVARLVLVVTLGSAGSPAG